MPVQRSDGFVVQSGDPEGPADGFIDPATGKLRTVPLEIMVQGDKLPAYGETLEELGRYKCAGLSFPRCLSAGLLMGRDALGNRSRAVAERAAAVA